MALDLKGIAREPETMDEGAERALEDVIAASGAERAPAAAPSEASAGGDAAAGSADEAPKRRGLGGFGALRAAPLNDNPEPETVDESAPSTSGAPEIAVDDFASLIQPKEMLSEDEARPDAAQSASTSSDEISLGEGTVQSPPAAAGSPEGGEKAKAGEDPEEDPDAEARAQFHAIWTPSMLANMPQDAQDQAFEAFKRQRADALAKTEGADAEQRRDMQQQFRGGGGGSPSLLGLLRIPSPSPELKRAMAAAGVGAASKVGRLGGALKDRIVQHKIGQTAGSIDSYMKAGESLSTKVGDFNKAFLTAAAASRLKDIAAFGGVSLDELVSDLSNRGSDPKMKAALDAARDVMRKPEVAASWNAVEAGLSELEASGLDAAKRVNHAKQAFGDAFDGDGADLRLAEAAKKAELVPAPVFEDPEVAKTLKERLAEAQEKIAEIARQIGEKIASLFKR